MRVLGEAEGVMRASQCGPQVAQHSIDGLELWQLDAGRVAAGHGDLVDTPARRKAVKQASPSETTDSGRMSDLSAKLDSALFVNGASAKQTKTGCPSLVVWTAGEAADHRRRHRAAVGEERLRPGGGQLRTYTELWFFLAKCASRPLVKATRAFLSSTPHRTRMRVKDWVRARSGDPRPKVPNQP